MAFMTAHHDAVYRLLDALGVAGRGVREVKIRIRVDAAVKVKIVMERLMHEEELDAVTDLLPLTNPVVEVVQTGPEEPPA